MIEAEALQVRQKRKSRIITVSLYISHLICIDKQLKDRAPKWPVTISEL